MPFLAILFGSLSFFVFDPLRSYFIESKVNHRFDLNRYKLLAWLRKETLGRLGLDASAKASSASRSGIEKERDEARTSLQSWLTDWPESFIVISGPRGSGKGAMLHQVLDQQPCVWFMLMPCEDEQRADSVGATHAFTRHVLSIDCAAICKKENNEKMIAELAKQFGYFPLFGFLNSISALGLGLCSFDLRKMEN